MFKPKVTLALLSIELTTIPNRLPSKIPHCYKSPLFELVLLLAHQISNLELPGSTPGSALRTRIIAGTKRQNEGTKENVPRTSQWCVTAN